MAIRGATRTWYASPHAWRASLVMVILLSLTAHGLAQTGSVLALPSAGLTPKYGVTLSVDTTWVEGLGYRPIRVTITPTKPMTFDRTFRVRIGGTQIWYENVAVIQDIELPAGSTPATPVTEILTLPQHGLLNNCRIDVWEDGRRLAELSNVNAGWLNSSQAFGATYPKILVISDSPVDLSAVKQILFADHPNNVAQLQGQANAGSQPGMTLPASIAATPTPTAYAIGTGNLPIKWIDYSAVDVICLSLDEMNLMWKTQPAALGAIEDWTRAGGNLVIHGVGERWDRRAELDLAMGDGKSPPEDGWTEARITPKQKFLVGNYEAEFDEDGMPSNAFAYGHQRQLNLSGQLDPSQLEKGIAPIAVLIRPWQTGLVVAVDGDLMPGSPRNWLHVLQAIGPERWIWNHRHGLSFHEANLGYWKFLIAGVGLVPVGAFRFLITVFVVGIGPVQFYLLRQRNRLHLSVITIPACAVLVTGALLAYAVLADGLGTKVRVRSYTRIDQRTGAAVCLGRASYYAGLAPSDGLAFSPDTAVYPYEAVPEMNHRRSGSRLRTVQWDDQQRLTKGWLPPRTPTQLLTVRSRRTNRGLAVAPQVKANNRLAMTNQLGTRIQHVWLCDRAGNLYAGGPTEDQATAELRPISPEDLRKDAANVFRPAATLTTPEGIDENRINSSGQYYDFHYSYGWIGIQYAQHGDRNSRMELGLREIDTAASQGTLPLGKRSYVAIVDHSPEMELGLEADEITDNFQVVVGNW